MSKKIKRDAKGNPILEGAILYKYDVRPKIRKSNSFDLKTEASNRLVSLMNGENTDKFKRVKKHILSDQECETNVFNRKLSESPKVVQLGYYSTKLKSLEKELKELEETSNNKKRELFSPAIRNQIEEHKKLINELYLEIRRERLVLSKIVRKEND